MVRHRLAGYLLCRRQTLRWLNARWRSSPNGHRRTIIQKRSTEAQAKTVTFTLALLPIIWVKRIVAGKSAAAVFVSETYITEELQFSNRREQFPFRAAKIGHEFLNVAFSVVSDLRLGLASGNDRGCRLSMFGLQAVDLRSQLGVLFFQ